MRKLTSTFSILAFSAVFLTGCSSVQGESQTRENAASERRIAPSFEGQPNILLIAIDDLRPDIGAYGHPSAVTPNMDKFARSAVLFENAITQQAVCAPSRAALMTGLRPDTTGITSLKQPIDETVPDAVTMADFFKARGYETLAIGKIYHHGSDDADGWSKEPFNTVYDIRKKRRRAGKTKVSRGVENNVEFLPDMQNVEVAKAELGRMAESDKPFFMAYGIHKPHLPFIAPQEFWDLYEDSDIPEPVSRTRQKGAPDWALVAYEVFGYDDTPDRDRKQKIQTMPESDADDLRKGYLAAVSYADSIVGEILDEVDRLNLADDTIVVIWGDHGFKLGDHNAWAKHSNAELDIRIPLMVRVPGTTRKGKTSTAMVETVDVYPTLTELAGYGVADNLEGLSVVPLLSDPNQDWKLASFAQFGRSAGPKGRLTGRTVRTENFRYTAWISERSGDIEAVELYDLANDPNELKSVANDPAYAEVVKSHELLRRQGWKAVRKEVTGQ